MWSAPGIKSASFALNDTAQAAQYSAANGEYITARDWADTAKEQIAALQNAGCDAILAVASTAPAGDWQKALLNSGVTAIIDATSSENGTNVLGAGLGAGRCGPDESGVHAGRRLPCGAAGAGFRRRAGEQPQQMAEPERRRGHRDSAARCRRPRQGHRGGRRQGTPPPPTETVDEAQQAGAEAYVYAAAKLSALDADDQSILYTPLFTYAENPDASRTISFGNYLAALYAGIAAADPASGLPEGAAVEAMAGGVTEPEYGDITRGDLMNALPATARIQLVSTTADAARALADSGVSRVYQNSLTEYAPRGMWST